MLLPKPILSFLWFDTPLLAYLVWFLSTLAVKVQQVGNGRRSSGHVEFSLWICDAGFSMTRSAAGNPGWAGEQGRHPVAIEILSILQRGRRIAIPKITSSREPEGSGSVRFPSVSSLSILSCQFHLSSPWGGSCRLHDLENGCNPKRHQRRRLLCLTSLFFLWKNLNRRDFMFSDG